MRLYQVTLKGNHVTTFSASYCMHEAQRLVFYLNRDDANPCRIFANEHVVRIEILNRDVRVYV